LRAARALHVLLRLASCGGEGRALFWRRQLHTRAPRLQQADRDRLLRVAGAVLAFADVVHLFADEFARLRERRLPFARVASRPGHGGFLWHVGSFV